MRMQFCAALALLGVAVAAEGFAAAPVSPGPTVYVHAGHVLADPAVGKVLGPTTIVITAGKIVRIEDGFTEAPGAEIVDLAHSFVLPGLIDSHVHLTLQTEPDSMLQLVRKSAAAQAMDGVAY